jgi:hypothetical protein
MDADLSYGPEYITMLADALERYNVEICLASPYCKGGTIRNVPFYRYFLSRYGNKYLGECCITPVFFKLQPLIKFQKPMDRYIMVNIWLSLSI